VATIPLAPNPDFAAVVRDSFARQGLMRHLGASLTRIEPGVVAIAMDFSDAVSQQHGYFHAGALASVADSAGGYAALALMPPGSSVVSVEFKVNMLTPALGERVEAIGTVVRAGRTLTVCQAEAFVERGGERTLCLILQQTLMRLEAREGRAEG